MVGQRDLSENFLRPVVVRSAYKSRHEFHQRRVILDR